MGKQNNLNDYLKDLYLGIASKKPDTSKNPQDFRSEIESLVFPEGTKAITNNGTHDIAQYKYASVNVSAPTPTTEEKTVTPTTSKQEITATNADYLSKVTVNAIPTTTQATPSISVSSSGLITASATQSAGYVSSGTKSATKQLTTKSAQTYTPTTSNQTISSGRYLTGTQTIKGDSNLVASNIKKGVSIFGVSGTYEGSGGSVPTTVKCYLSIGSAPSGFSTVEYTGPNGLALYDFQNSAEVELTVIPGSLLTISFADAMMGGGAMGDLLHYELYWNIGNTFCAITVPPEDFMLFATY